MSKYEKRQEEEEADGEHDDEENRREGGARQQHMSTMRIDRKVVVMAMVCWCVGLVIDDKSKGVITRRPFKNHFQRATHHIGGMV